MKSIIIELLSAFNEGKDLVPFLQVLENIINADEAKKTDLFYLRQQKKFTEKSESKFYQYIGTADNSIVRAFLDKYKAEILEKNYTARKIVKMFNNFKNMYL